MAGRFMQKQKKKQRNRPKKSFLYGKNSIVERLKSFPETVRQVFISDKFSDKGLVKRAQALNIPVKVVSEKELSRIKYADRLQGIVARVENFKYSDLEELLQTGIKRLMFLDSITDPHNLGAIIRTLACIGGFGLVIGRHNSCLVNDTVMHVASGGENYVPVSLVNSLPMALMRAKATGFFVYGAIVENGVDIPDVDFAERSAIVLGSEGRGISPGIRKQIDTRIKIPMKGVNLSFNVSVACGIIAYEAGKR